MSEIGPPVACQIRYFLDEDRREEFDEYAATWTKLIRRYGGLHQGFYFSRPAPAGSVFSYPGIGDAAEDPVAIALYSFADEEAYRRHRVEIAGDPEGVAANERWRDSPPFRRYERTFLIPPDSDSGIPAPRSVDPI